MNAAVQTILAGGVALLAAALGFRVCGPPERRVPCVPAELKDADDVCLGTVTGAWGGRVLWVDARPRAEWRRDGLAGSVLFSIEPGEDINEMEAGAAPRIAEAERVVVYCSSASCGTARQVAAHLRELNLGPHIYVLYGGWKALKGAGMIKAGSS